jgi:signal transduction histidine kinase
MDAILELLEDLPNLDPGDAAPLIGRLRRSLTWLEGLAENVSLWTALESGHVPLRGSPLKVLDWIEPALAVVQPILDRTEQSIRLVCSTPVPRVFGDAHLLGQVLINLLTNASRYSRWGDVLEVTVSTQDEWVEVRVTDHGPGIPESEQTQIFGRYVRGSGAAQQAVSGLGLGLHIVQRLVAAHGGQVGVDSVPGVGASFWFRLPCLAAGATEPDASSALSGVDLHEDFTR